MTEYKSIVGTKIKNYTTNPDNADTGQVWYNETDNVLKFQFANVSSAGSWATGGNLNTARSRGAGAGTKAGGLLFGGDGPSRHAETESYNGTSWTEVNDLNTGIV